VAVELQVFLTADIGPADAVLGAGHETNGSWQATDSGLAVAVDVLHSIEDRFGMALPVTWFLRADALIHRQFGSRLAIFEKLSLFAQRAGRDGHEVAWMPQVYAGSRADVAIDYDDLAITHAALTGAALAPRSVRMGNCFHDNRTMKLLSDLGVEIDSSAVPGRVKSDLGWRMDWEGTPRQPYRPSLSDYRRPGVPALRILEVPLSVRPIKAPYDAEPLLRYLNPCMHRQFFGQNLRDVLADSPHLVLIFHPDEAVPPGTGTGHPLVAYSKDELAFNLLELIQECARLNRAVSLLRLEDLAGRWPERGADS
jgi:hypothetical protein